MSYINTIIESECLEGLKTLPDNYVHCCVTSPPYWGLRDYGVDGQLGLESTPELFIEKMVQIFTEVKRVLRNDGTLWLNLSDSYGGSGKGAATHPKTIHNFKSKKIKPKDLVGIPWMVAFALRNSGWYLRQDIIWSKPNPMPESVKDRCTKSHEYIFLLSKSSKYFYDYEAIKTKMNCSEHDARTRISRKRFPSKLINGIRGNNATISEFANKRSVWTVTTKGYKDAHFATYPEKLIIDCIKAGCPENGIVLDPFMGSGTTAIVARKLYRNYIGFELNPKYIEIAERRLEHELGMFI